MAEGKEALSSYVTSHLDEAIESGWIEVYYQPVIRTLSGMLCGMEALARWNDPRHGLIEPNVLIGTLESAQRIHDLDSLVIRQVCRQLHDDIEAERPVVPISFNLSRLDFALCDITGVIEKEARDNEVPHSLLNIEITESVFGVDPNSMASIIDGFHRAGYQVWMDDFGSAYSSLNMLKNFEVDEIKIDMGFLNRFGNRSRTIIASVVDMAKRLGIETLAEGVETREHAEFLRHIGCEKQQGFLYGKPEPHSRERIDGIAWEFGIEQPRERAYFRTIGGVNTLSLSERDFMPESTAKDYVTSMPLAFVEYDGEFFNMLDCNDPFAEALESLGLPGAETIEELINDISLDPARTSRRLVEVIRRQKYARHDYLLTNGRTCVMRARHVASVDDRITMLVTLESAEHMQEQERRDRMNQSFAALLSIYEHIDIIHLDEGYSEPVYSQAVFKNVYDVPSLADSIRQFADSEIYPDDRERYRAFMDVESMKARIGATSQGFLADFFRARDCGGDYAWKQFLLIGVAETAGRDVMVCIRDTNRENDALLQAVFEPDGELHDARDASNSVSNGDAIIREASLWRTIEHSSRFGIFWKDTDRRFVGCNRTFLDYFELDSLADVRGKTDEDMGWHIDPVPFREDELRILNEGATFEGTFGQCVVNGEIRDIVASKQPIYENGRIVGLLGYFIDAAERKAYDELAGNAPYIDPVTGTLNSSGIDAAIDRFIEAYQRTGASFALAMVEIDNYKHIDAKFGYDFGSTALAAMANAIKSAAGSNCVVGRVRTNRFAVLKQSASVDEADALCTNLVHALASLTEVEGTPCTVYAHAARAQCSEADDAEGLKSIACARLRK